MYKKIISLCLIVCMTLGTVTSAFAANNRFKSVTSMDNGVEKTTMYIGNNKLVSWDDGNYIHSEQYDLEGNLIEYAVGDRSSGKVLITNDEATYTTNAKDIVSVISIRELPSTRAFSKIETIPVINMTTLDKKTMYLYQETGSGSTTSYNVKVYNGKMANFVTSVATGLSISSLIASNVVGAFVAAGLGIVSGELIAITSSKTLAASKYPLSYYGKDSKTNKISDTMKNRGDKYIITETGSKLINETYYEGLSFNPKDEDASSKLLSYIIPNLYGSNYEWNNF